LVEAYPHLADKIIGAGYNGQPKWKSLASTAASIGAWAILALVLIGLDRCCELTGVPKESISPTIVELFQNKGTAIVGFLLLNTVSTQLMASGAFEVYLEDASSGRRKTIFSALANGGRIANPVQIALMLRDAGLLMSPSFEARMIDSGRR
jgi:hypothetical protein